MKDDGSSSQAALREGAALVVIDVQKGFDEPYWGERNNPEAEENIARLLEPSSFIISPLSSFVAMSSFCVARLSQ